MSSKFFGICAAILIVWLYIGSFWLDAPAIPVQTTPAELTEFDKLQQLARQHCKEPPEQLFSWKWSTDGKIVTCMPWQGKPYTVKIK